MTYRLRSVGLDYIDTAPVRLAFVAEASAGPEAVFGALADVEGWSHWFRQVSEARATDDGTGRLIRLVGGGRFRETVMASDPGERYAYRVDEANVPGLRALLEEWRLVPWHSGTVVRYTFALDGTVVTRASARLFRPVLRRAFHDAVRCLDRRLTTV
ncbi:SRPBCC family protein [Streptomyces sp. NPDC021212]|uniref:SRPBCC family protein n=1 Tax=Streptomyces sp. NPDC021212 TaxID=3365118 RepID=UPI0037B82D4B